MSTFTFRNLLVDLSKDEDTKVQINTNTEIFSGYIIAVYTDYIVIHRGDYYTYVPISKIVYISETKKK